MDDREDLPALSQAGLEYGDQSNVTSQDKTDESTLRRIQHILGEMIEEYRSVEMLDMEQKELSLAEQVKVNQLVIAELRNIKAAVDATIDDINISQEG